MTRLRRKVERPSAAKPFVPANVLEFPCTICNAKPGERCTNVLEASEWREPPHARRIELARKGVV